MTPYETYLNRIANDIAIKDTDRQIYTKDYDIIRDYVLGAICKMDPVFNKIYKGTCLFGSYANNVRIRCPSEFDVIFKLRLPFWSEIIVEQDLQHPGYVNLQFNEIMNILKNNSSHQDVYNKFTPFVDRPAGYLQRTNLKIWLDKLFLNVHKKYVDGHNKGDRYLLKYSNRGVAYTFNASCGARSIDIDFVPAICISQPKWAIHNGLMGYEDEWYANPKPCNSGPNATMDTFVISNHKAEHDLLLDKQNLKIVFRLLKSIRDRYGMENFKSYFFTTAFLWETMKYNNDFWKKPLGELLEHMLKVVHNYFSKGFFPNFWNDKHNLLDVLQHSEELEYTRILHELLHALKVYKIQSSLLESTCRKHFKERFSTTADRMTPYEIYLNRIANDITIKDSDRQIYTKDFDRIRDHVLGTVCEMDPVFKKIYNGPSLFGSYANNVRINCPKEFDVIFKLCLPFSSEIIAEQDPDRPGFVRLDFENLMDILEDNNGHQDVFQTFEPFVDWTEDYLRRSNLQEWLHNLFLATDGNIVNGHLGDQYSLQYSKRGLAHTIYASCRARSISIDLVPAICIRHPDWMKPPRHPPFTYKCKQWYAIPKPSLHGPVATKPFAFQIFNPKAEHDLLLSNQNLKVTFRLLKSLRDQYELNRFKSYFFTTAFLWEIKKRNRRKRNFWNKPLHELFEHMLDVISGYLRNGFLPFFWDKELNLLDILDEDEITDYADTLVNVYNTLISYKHQPKLSEARCREHFTIYEQR